MWLYDYYYELSKKQKETIGYRFERVWVGTY